MGGGQGGAWKELQNLTSKGGGLGEIGSLDRGGPAPLPDEV